MGQLPSQAGRFRERLREILRHETSHASTIRIAKHEHVYMCGDLAKTVYFVERGQIKLLMLAPDGKQCLVAIYTTGDLFGELCLAEVEGRLETATAMEDSIVKHIPCTQFMLQLSQDALLEDFIRYLTGHIAEQQQIIANLMTVNSEERLGQALLQLSRKLGQPHLCSICIPHRISHEELSEMVGTTRPRISLFMKRFRDLGLIKHTPEHYLMVKEKRLTTWLEQGSLARGRRP